MCIRDRYLHLYFSGIIEAEVRFINPGRCTVYYGKCFAVVSLLSLIHISEPIIKDYFDTKRSNKDGAKVKLDRFKNELLDQE